MHKQIYVSLTEQLKSEIKEEGGKALMNTKTRNQYPTNENRTNIKMSNNTKTTDLEVRHKAITELKRTKFIAMYKQNDNLKGLESRHDRPHECIPEYIRTIKCHDS